MSDTLPRIRRFDIVLAQTPPSPLSGAERGSRVSRRHRASRSVFVGTLVLLAIHLGFGQYAERNPERKDPTYGDKLDKLTARADDRPLMLMLGSSRTLLGFHAGQVEGELPAIRAFNFGTPAAGPITHLVYLRRLVEAGIVPELLLIEVLPPALADGADGPAEQAFFTGERLSSDEVELVSRFGFNGDRVRAAWRESVCSPASALRFQLLGRVAPSWIPWNLRNDWSRNTDPHGWATPPRQSISNEERFERTSKADLEYRGALIAMTPEGRPLLALAELLQFCRTRNIPTRVVVMSEAPSFQNLYPAGLSDRIVAVLNAVARERGSSVIDARHWLEEDDFYDGHHLFRAGAERFTNRLTREAIQPHIAGVAR